MTGPSFARIAEGIRGCAVREDLDLRARTSVRIGQTVRLWAEPQDPGALGELVKACAANHRRYAVIGSGTNVLVSGRCTDMVFIHLGAAAFSAIATGSGFLRAGAGATIAQVLSVCQQQGLSGLEFLAGVPGTVGGAVVMNAGEGEGERAIGDTVARVRVMDPSGQVRQLTRGEIAFGYRSSGLERVIVLDAECALSPDDPARIGERIGGHMARKRAAQDLWAAGCGSLFKNPPAAVGMKAWQLIDGAGFRGAFRGGARISEKHANFLVNTGQATFEDVTALIRDVQEGVMRKYHVFLEPEVRIIE